MGFDTSDALLRSLKPDGETLGRLREDFASMLEGRTFKVHSFQEGQGYKGARALSRKIVDDNSSSLDHPIERKDTINANHVMMCRFNGPEDNGYIKVKGVISKYVDEVGGKKDQGMQIGSLDNHYDWRLPQLEAVFHKILDQDGVSGCIVLIIDALDEFSDRDEETARFLKELMSSSQGKALRIRLCVSSRPHNAFRDMLGHYPSIAMQDWNAEDIEKFVDDRLILQEHGPTSFTR
ncbi:hypothetical protein F4810DRAFT_712421 [Camillea tinctor]|nr:hypothetical protein F4810DRAFT_712421 [Camillea tinctor]